MKNFKKLSSNHLTIDELSKIKGGTVMMSCDAAYQNCIPTCDKYDPTTYIACVLALEPTCSPLEGYQIYCGPFD